MLPATPHRPVWLLDVDGVVNAPRAGWSRAPFRGHATAYGRRLRMEWEPTVVDVVRRLHTTGVVEVMWCTTWCPFADTLERLWSLPPLPRAFDGEEALVSVTFAKHAAAQRMLADGRPLIWTDDDEVPSPDEPLYQRLAAVGPPVLLIQPDHRYGLRPADITAIEEFGQRHAPPA